MTNIDLRFSGYANFNQVQREVATLQAEFAALNAQMAKQAYGKGPDAFSRAQRDAAKLQQAYGNALASTRQFDVSQRRINSQTDEYVKNLQKQREGVRSLAQNFRSLASGQNAAYREQLRLQRMSVTSFTKDKYGNPLATMAVPTEVPRELDTVRNRLGMIAQATNSASTQMINWGKNTQWAGRQLMVGFTMPIIAFGALAARSFYDIDKNLTRIAKVYDTTAHQFGSANDRAIAKEQELSQLRADGLTTARELAQQYGAAAKDTLDIQAQLAATGVRGPDLQELTKDTQRFAILGEFEYQDAIKTTIALQATYKMSTEEVAEAVNYMNAVENATSMSMKDFATAIPIAAGPMKDLGVGVKELGFLMTGMIEKGVPASQAANALKSSLIRLYNPSKEVAAKFEELTGKSLEGLVKKSKGQVIPLLKEIGLAVEGMAPEDRTKVLGALFGAYQVSRLSNLLQSVKEADQGIGQAAKALEIAGLSASETSGIAMEEMAKKANSVSGQFDRALETIKVDLATSGEGFMEWATRVLNAGSAVIQFFQSLPDSVKGILKTGVVIGAIAGPLLMLTGLFGNLIGQGVKVGASLLLMATRFRLVNREQAAAGAVANFASRGLGREVTLLEAMKAELLAVSGALATATAQQQGFATATDRAAAALSRQRGVQAGTHAGAAGGRSPGQIGAVPVFGDRFAQPKNAKQPIGGTAGQKMGLSGGLMAAGTVGMFMPNEAVANISQYVMLLGIALPLMHSLHLAAKGLPLAFGKAAAAVKGMNISLAAARVFAVGLLGSFGAITAALAVVGVAAYAFYKHMKKGSDQTKAMHSDVEGLGKVFGFTPKRYAMVDGDAKANQQQLDLVRKLNAEYPKLADHIRSANGEKEKFARAAEQGFKAFNAGQTVEEAKTVTRTALMAAGETAASADALIIKFGFDPAQVNQQVMNLRNHANNMVDAAQNQGLWDKLTGGSGVGQEIAGQFGKDTGIILNRLISEGDVAMANQRMTQIVAEFNQSIQGLDQGAQRQLAQSMVESLGQQLNASEGQIERVVQAMKRRGAESGQYKVTEQDILSLQSAQTNMMQDQANKARALAGAKRAQAQMEQDNASGARNYTSEQMKAVNALVTGKKLTAEQYFLVVGLGSKNKAINDLIKARIQAEGNLLGLINAEGAAVDVVKNKNQALLNVMRQRGWVGKNDQPQWQKASFEMYKDSFNTAWQAVGQEMQSDIDAWGSNYMSSLSQQHQAASQALQASHQRASNALQQRHQAASNALQRRQTAANNRLQAAHDRQQRALDEKWQKRKKQLQDEEDLRKQMFENELNRVERMKEAKNLNVDYRVAVSTGNLDEAAKIRNEGVANTETWALEDADAKAQAAFDKEMERLAIREEREKAYLQRKQQREQQALQAQQQREQQAMQKRQQAEQQALQASQQRQQAALQRSQAAAQANAQRMIDIKKREVAMRLQQDLAYVPKSRADAQRHIGEMIARYRKMGIDLSAFSTKYGKTLYNTLNSTLKKNINALASEVAWEKLGRAAGSKYIKAIWGKSLKGFMKWIESEPKAPGSAGTRAQLGNKSVRQIQEGRHRGGIVGTGGGDRTGYAASNSVMPSEKLILAKKGEGILTTRAMRKIGPEMLNALNRGEPIGRQDIHTGNLMTRKPRTGGTSLNWHLEANTIGQILGRGTKKVIQKKGEEAKARDAAFAASMGGLVGGKDLIVGGGGWMRPWRRRYPLTQGLHGAGGLDYGLPNGTPIYSPAAGRVSASYDIGGRGGYSSYGRLMRTSHGGASLLFAHMSSRGKRAGAPLNKGSYLGRSGNTGNSTGPHVHIEARRSGRVVDPRRLFGANGVALRQGGELKYDNTMVQAHKGETMLSTAMTQKLKEGVELARTDTKRYYRDINVYPQGNVDMDPRELALAIKEELDHEETRYG